MLEGIAVAIPTFNEVGNVQVLLPAIAQTLPHARIVVIDDNSPDGTAEAVQQISVCDSRIELISRPRKEGLAAAYLHAFTILIKRPDIQWVVTMDADFSHDPKHLPAMLAARTNAELVVGSRYVPGGATENWSFTRRMLSLYGNHYARWITGLPIRDLTAGFVLYRRDILEKILKIGVLSKGYAYQIEMKHLALKCGARFQEVPITFRERRRGVSKLERGVVWEGIVRPWRLRFDRRSLFL